MSTLSSIFILVILVLAIIAFLPIFLKRVKEIPDPDPTAPASSSKKKTEKVEACVPESFSQWFMLKFCSHRWSTTKEVVVTERIDYNDRKYYQYHLRCEKCGEMKHINMK